MLTNKIKSGNIKVRNLCMMRHTSGVVKKYVWKLKLVEAVKQSVGEQLVCV